MNNSPQSLVVVQLYGEFSQYNAIADMTRRFCEGLDLVEGVDFDIVAGFVDDPQFDLGDSSLPSKKQLWYLNKCVADARMLLEINGANEELEMVVRVAMGEMADSSRQMTRSRASELIDALKDFI